MKAFSKSFKHLTNLFIATYSDELNEFITELLVHRQYNQAGEFFQELKSEKGSLSNVLPQYYAYLRLANNDDRKIESMPPEIEEVVDDFEKEVLARRGNYYPE